MNDPITVLCGNGFELIDYLDGEMDTVRTMYHFKAENGREFKITFVGV